MYPADEAPMLTNMEQRALEMLLAGDNQILGVLRTQLNVIAVARI
jgi:hypothetical protein